MMTVFPIRRATLADVPQIEACVNAAYAHYTERIGSPPGPMLDDYTEHVTKNMVFVAHENVESAQDRALLGLLVLIKYDEYLLLDNVAVDPSAQGQGVGKFFMAFAEWTARELGFTEIRLYTHESMVENQAIYKKLGYEEFERKFEKGLARVYMRKNLTG